MKDKDNFFTGLDEIGPVIGKFRDGANFEYLQDASLVCELLNRLCKCKDFKVFSEDNYSHYIYQEI